MKPNKQKRWFIQTIYVFKVDYIHVSLCPLRKQLLTYINSALIMIRTYFTLYIRRYHSTTLHRYVHITRVVLNETDYTPNNLLDQIIGLNVN